MRNDDASVPLITMDLAKSFLQNVDRSSTSRAMQSKSGTLVMNLKLHVTIVAISNPTSWLHQILIDPSSMKDKLIPSMTDSDLAQMMISGVATSLYELLYQ